MTTGGTVTVKALKILVVEDNIINQRLVVALLHQLGHTGVVVSDGEKAMRCLAQLRFDAVLLDVMMPVMDGMQTLLALRGLEKSTKAHLPVIMATAHDDPADKRRFMGAGADGYIIKPISAESLKMEFGRIFGF
jgi:CheY-like chemotaxis protein